jgi:tRNA nucleotidyltransferase/poly(A) polymerase
VPADPIRVAIRVAEILDRLGVPYAVGGSVASAIAGEPRSTEDVDIAADMRPEMVPAIVAALGGEFYIDEAAARDAAARGGSFNIIHLELVQKVDIFVLGHDLLDRRQIERRRRARLAMHGPGAEALDL